MSAMGGMTALAPVAALAPLAPVPHVAMDQHGVQQLTMPGAAPADDVVTAVVGPECKEIIIVECDV